MASPWRQVALRLAEALGLIAVAYVMGGVILAIRLFKAGLPSGSEALGLFPSQQVLATGAGALLGAVVLPVFILLALAVVALIARPIGFASRRVFLRRGTRERKVLGRAQMYTELVIALVLALGLLLATGGGSLGPPGGTVSDLVNPLVVFSWR